MSIMKTYGRFDLNFEKGKDSYLYDIKGDKYLDFVAGIAVNSLGHSNEKMVEVIKEQSEKLLHISNLYYDNNQINLAKKIIDLSNHNSVFFCNSGTEAVEGALKIARKYGKDKNKNKILYFSTSFHGRTMGALSVTSKERYREDFKPMLKNMEMVEFNNKEDFLNKFDETVCGVIVEPIQGEGGINASDKDFLELLRKTTEENDALLIFDEVQCGVGRTAKFFAYKIYNVIPDIITLAKGLGGGVPIGAFVVNKKADILVPGDHGCTFGGNPLVTAVAGVVVDIISDEKFLKSVEEKGQYLKEKLNELKEKYEIITNIKGTGLMLGIDFNIEVKGLVNKAIEEKLLIINAGDKVIRLVPPLTVSYDEIDEFIEKFENVLK